MDCTALQSSHPGKTRIERGLDWLADADSRYYLCLLFLGAVALRMIGLVSLRQLNHAPGMQAGIDGIDFANLGRALAQGRGFVWPNGRPTSFRAPGFPIYLSAIFYCFHLSYLAANLSFPIVGAAGSISTYLLAKEAVSERAARLAGVLFALYFPAIYFCTVWLSEPLFMLIFALSLWQYLIHLRTRSCWALAIAGVLFSCSVLVRPFAILMLPALLYLEARNSRNRLFACSLLLVCAIAPLSIWTARNYRVHHAFVLVATNGGSTFYGGNNDLVLNDPRYMGAWVSTVHLAGRPLINAAANEYQHDHVEWRLGVAWVRENLTKMPLLIAMKLVRFTLPDFDSQNRLFAILSVFACLPFYPLWIFGTRAIIKRKHSTVPWLVLHCAMAATVATALIFWGSPRFRDAAAPILMVYAALGAEQMSALRRSS
jgi:4-amino-4-deoxy-L-arabinose transferase-like glycosyltransferase